MSDNFKNNDPDNFDVNMVLYTDEEHVKLQFTKSLDRISFKPLQALEIGEAMQRRAKEILKKIQNDN